MRLLLLVMLATACSPRSARLEAAADTHTARGRNHLRLELADALLESRNTVEARHLLTLALGEGADPWEVALRQAEALQLEGLRDEAAERFTRLATQRPSDPRPWKARALLEADRADLEAAIASLETAAALAPRDAAILNNLGFLRLVHGDAEHAVGPLTQAVALDGKNLKYQTNLAYALATLKRDDDAWAGFRALTGDAEAYARMGLVAELRSDVDAARRRYREALAADPQNFTASSGMTRLETTESP